MKAMLFTLALAAAQTCATSGGPVELRTISGGGFAASRQEEIQSVAARDKAEYENAWNALIGQGTPPEVDFTKEAVVFLLGGMKPTGGWSIDVKGAAMDGTTLVIDAPIKGPPPRSIVTQVITYPYAVVAVHNRSFDKVRWPAQ